MNALCPRGAGGGCFFVSIEKGGKKMSVRCSGTLFVFLAAVLYSTAGLCMKLIPWSGMALNGGRSIIALGVFGAYLLLTRHKP